MEILTNMNLQMIRELNNEGKNSNVYIMKDTQLNADLVVKCIPKKYFFNPDEYFNEAAILYNVQHPNIAKIQHATEDNNNVYFSMPFYKKGSIESLINTRFLTIKEIIQFSLDFLNGLHFVHTKELIHFDIKPTNILIDDNGKAILTDFGLSKYTDNNGLSFPDKIYPFHIPPEMLQGSVMSNKADIYQVGMTLYRMCNGNENYSLQLNKYSSDSEFKDDVIKGKFPDRNFYLPHIPKKLRKIINKALNVNTDDRYKTVLDLSNELSTIDKNLKIVYSKDKNTRSENWVYPSSGTHDNCINLCKNVNAYDIIVEKVRKTDNKRFKIRSLCSNGYKRKNDALKYIEKILK